jgi:hypothetical protein
VPHGLLAQLAASAIRGLFPDGILPGEEGYPEVSNCELLTGASSVKFLMDVTSARCYVVKERAWLLADAARGYDDATAAASEPAPAAMEATTRARPARASCGGASLRAKVPPARSRARWRRLVATGDLLWSVQRSTMRRAATFLLTLCGAAAFVGKPSTTKTPVALRSTAETAAPTKRVITITPDALTHIKKLREDNGPDTHLRMGVRAGGRVRRRPRARARGAPAAVDRSSTGSPRARRSRPRRAARRADTTSLPPP